MFRWPFGPLSAPFRCCPNRVKRFRLEVRLKSSLGSVVLRGATVLVLTRRLKLLTRLLLDGLPEQAEDVIAVREAEPVNAP